MFVLRKGAAYIGEFDTEDLGEVMSRRECEPARLDAGAQLVNVRAGVVVAEIVRHSVRHGSALGWQLTLDGYSATRAPEESMFDA